ncbi:MAG: hypothetical protein Q8O67_24255 [Deltaproteobacteria bacterium]|nr:hypothetical protein [Deltaproteobacteria bacterium]
MLVSTVVVVVFLAAAPPPQELPPRILDAGVVLDAGSAVDAGAVPPTANFDFGTPRQAAAAAMHIPKAVPWVLLAVLVIVLGVLWNRMGSTRRRPPTGTGSSSPGE